MSYDMLVWRLPVFYNTKVHGIYLYFKSTSSFVLDASSRQIFSWGFTHGHVAMLWLVRLTSCEQLLVEGCLYFSITTFNGLSSSAPPTTDFFFKMPRFWTFSRKDLWALSICGETCLVSGLTFTNFNVVYALTTFNTENVNSLYISVVEFQQEWFQTNSCVL